MTTNYSLINNSVRLTLGVNQDICKVLANFILLGAYAVFSDVFHARFKPNKKSTI